MYRHSLHHPLRVIRLPTNLRSLVIGTQRCWGSSLLVSESRTPPKDLFDLLLSKRRGVAQRDGGKTSTKSQRQSPTKREKLPRSALKKHNSTPLARQSAAKGASDGVEPVKLSKEQIQDEGKARMQVYDYAASQGLVPEFVYDLVPARRMRGRPSMLIKATIKLPEQGIVASAAVSHKFRDADIAASIEFKRQAEKYQSQHVDNTDTSNYFHLLTCVTAKDFFKHIKFIDRRRPDYSIVSEPIKKPRMEGHAYIWVVADGEEIIGTKTLSWKHSEGEQLAWLVAAVEIAKREPALLTSFREALVIGNGKLIQPMGPMDLHIRSDTLRIMHGALRSVNKIRLPSVEEDSQGSRSQLASRRFSRPPLSPAQIKRANENLAARLKSYESNPRLETLRSTKKSLPMNQYSEKVLKLINENIYSIVVGATGSGKTTQVPQILLDDAIRRGEGANCDIICTQPRRIAAMSVAQRVAVERDEPLCQSVGYQVRFDKQLPAPGGSVTFCTTGILLEQLKHDADQVFNSASHLLIDEVHERDLNIDFLMIVLKRAIKTRRAAGKPVPRVVLMSATLDIDLFSKYFVDSEQPGIITPCPTISVPGRTFPVKENYLGGILEQMEDAYGSRLHKLLSEAKCRDFIQAEKSLSLSSSGNGSTKGAESVIEWKRQRPTFDDAGSVEQPELLEDLVPVPLVAATLAHICNTTHDGAILVFLPGLKEIQATQDLLQTGDVLGVDFNNTHKFKVSILHSSVTKEDQSTVFETVPLGCRKVILSTNIAETSVTIPDVQYVVDCGKLRERRYDQRRRITKLQCTWISKSNSKQRAGRAGRVQNGNYFALFSRERFEMLRSIGLPELLRTDLQETCLATKMHALQDSVGDFLQQAIEPPPPTAVEIAVKSLKAMEALTENEELTPLGRLLARLPVHPTLGKMIVLGVIFKCLDPLLILGAAAGERSILVEPLDKRAEARKTHQAYHANQKSDHILMLNAFNHMREIFETRGEYHANDICFKSFLHVSAFKSIRNTAESILEVLGDVGLIRQVSPLDHNYMLFGHPSLNENSHNFALIKCLILAGLHPNLASKPFSRSMMLRTRLETSLIVSPSSINKTSRVSKSRGDDLDKKDQEKILLTYSSLSESGDGNLSIRDTTVVTPLMAALFGSSLEKVVNNRLEVDKWLPMYVQADDNRGATNLIVDFKKALDSVMSYSFHSLSSLGGSTATNDDISFARETLAKGLVDVLNAEEDWEQNRNIRQTYNEHQPRFLDRATFTPPGLPERALKFSDRPTFTPRGLSGRPLRSPPPKERPSPRRSTAAKATSDFANKYPHLFAFG